MAAGTWTKRYLLSCLVKISEIDHWWYSPQLVVCEFFKRCFGKNSREILQQTCQKVLYIWHGTKYLIYFSYIQFTLIFNSLACNQNFNNLPVLCPQSAQPDEFETVLRGQFEESEEMGKELDLLIAILPNNNGPLYGKCFYLLLSDYVGEQ